MVGLFLAVFVKPSLNNRISCLNVDTVETGLKGYHGNKVKTNKHINNNIYMRIIFNFINLKLFGY